jgi:hypothetical protein
MRAFPAAAELQNYGCTALANICVHVRDNQLAAGSAGGLDVTISAMRAHASNAAVQLVCFNTLGVLVCDVAANQRRARELGGVEAMVAALRDCSVELIAAACDNYFERWCEAVMPLLHEHPASKHKAIAAGALELLVAHLCAPDAHTPAVCDWACLLLTRLLFDNGHDARAVQAGVLEALEAHTTSHAGVDKRRRELVQRLHPVARRHDAAPCAVAGCQRCTAARTSGAMCALPGCGARCRDGAANKKLLRCGTCRAACYCGAAHQREDWRRHKGACGAAAREDGRDAGASGS